MNNLKINKKVMSTVITSLIVVGSISGAVFAAQNDDIVEKDVLMTVQVQSNEDPVNPDDANSVPTEDAAIIKKGESHENEEYFNQTNISAKVNKDEAIIIAKDAVKNIFEINVTVDDKAIQADYFDKSHNDASYKGKSIWVVSWKTQPNTSYNSNSVFVDAETGEVLSMSSKKPNQSNTIKGLSKAEAESKVAEFIKSKNLNNGAAIQAIQSNISSKGIIEVEAKFDNGKEINVVISCATNEIVCWWK